MLQEVLNDFNISEISGTQLDAFINSLTGPGISKAHFRKFLLYVLKCVEYNRAKYEKLKSELGRLKEESASIKDELVHIKDELMTLMVSYRIPPEPSAPRVTAPPPPSAPQAAATIPPLAPQATAPTLPKTSPAAALTLPIASRAAAPIPPLASQAMAPPSAFQAMAPPPAPQAMAIGPVVSSTFCPAVVNADGTIYCKMDQVGNNVTVTFSGNDQMASKKSKLFGSSAKLDTFAGHDMSQFPEWVAQYLSGVNLFQPTEPSVCRVALLRGKAAEMAKNIPQQVSMVNLQELLTSLDKIFNTTGNRFVAVNLFNSFSQREDMSVQDHSIGIEQLFYRAYPGVDPNGSMFLMDHFITGLVSPQVKEKLRIPPQLGNFRDVVNSTMAFTATMFPAHQTLRQRSLAWKMAASASQPLHTKSIHKDSRGSIQMVNSSLEGNASV